MGARARYVASGSGGRRCDFDSPIRISSVVHFTAFAQKQYAVMPLPLAIRMAFWIIDKNG